MIKTRFAPSPTGALHIGGVRTALFSYLFAKALKGKFVLRVEDTDIERSSKCHSDGIIEAMNWLGLHADEGPIYQSDRLDRYREVAQQLLAEGKAYRCYCSKERLENLRAQQMLDKEKPRYDGHCRDNISNNADDTLPHVIRLQTPRDGTVEFDDLVYGSIRVSNQELDDLVLIRSDGMPTYNFAVVVDDADMSISHVIRGEDHINNTPRQIHVYHACGWKLPKFAHLPMILGEDGKKLSKRHGAVNVLEFREMGYLPEALLNDLVRLGWSHHDQEIFSMNDMIRHFDLAHVSRSPAVFNYEKLDWLNQHYLKQGSINSVQQIKLALLEQFKAMGVDVIAEFSAWEDLIKALVERAKTLRELAEKSRCYVEKKVQYSDELMRTCINNQTKPMLEKLVQELRSLPDWTKESIHQVIQDLCASLGVGMGKIAQPLRLVVTGTVQSPSIDETLLLVGQERTLERLNYVIQHYC